MKETKLDTNIIWGVLESEIKRSITRLAEYLSNRDYESAEHVKRYIQTLQEQERALCLMDAENQQ